VLKAVCEYIDFGPVARVEELAAAEVFNDLLAIAERHCAASRADAAAAIAGAIVEDVLWRNARRRKLAIREQIDSPATLNQKLWQAGVYATAIKQKIDDWMRLTPGHAAGEPAPPLGELAALEVLQMIKGVRNFVADFLT
jgi:hypothetical protein